MVGSGRLRTVVLGPGAAVTVAAAGSVALVARPWVLAHSPRPVEVLVAVFGVLLFVGAVWPFPTDRARPRRGTAAVVLMIGVAAFAAGRVLGGGHAPLPALWTVIVLNTVAAVAEEAFFRRLVYDTFLPGGAALAVAGSTILFALVHVTVYGLWVLPLDLAAGLVLSWQRWASGSWHVPALTHALANILVVI